MQPVTYYQPAVVTWQAPAPQYGHWREERRGHGHYRHHDHHRGHGYDYRR
jgi:hypothetical protein